ncbi:NAD(P)H-dependent glycerol-3-phosphate dehydrogenase [Histidinibacterium lentulum]|uniref:Glycerol-3-phosphate dehydrogenase [NAD(P)+] n=1 Tax=Histidinibacterium lentulum TaxID=2480588 RepID=A0A3N2R6T3_9RHOB|nr:NAD(P)H-dependent glycerol-3-phosphate dehydrogenase [Histidinibacterium lentulum]ROU03195.1 NAD(P)-dependent glycerol-3-phosphate dehydrogenase [Histidinibacterium lentulum]
MITVAGGGAFGTALAAALAASGPVKLWVRDPAAAAGMQETRENTRRLPGIRLPDAVTVTAETEALASDEAVLLAIPAQALAGFLDAHRAQLEGRALVACAKGIDAERLTGPAATIAATLPGSTAAILTGPSFARDIALGLPTALTLACRDRAEAERLQHLLSTPCLRLYRTTDVIGAELGGALKNVIAIAAGATIAKGYGASARAALMTRGFAEMQRLAAHRGADPTTLMGLSGFGDLTLTCTSDQSRNYRFGHAWGAGERWEDAGTVEGVKTAGAVARIAAEEGIDMPITTLVAAVVAGEIDIDAALRTLLARPLKEE